MQWVLALLEKVHDRDKQRGELLAALLSYQVQMPL
jgi:hypothetical protein